MNTFFQVKMFYHWVYENNEYILNFNFIRNCKWHYFCMYLIQAFPVTGSAYFHIRRLPYEKKHKFTKKDNIKIKLKCFKQEINFKQLQDVYILRKHHIA